jgi:hypothetical protein
MEEDDLPASPPEAAVLAQALACSAAERGMDYEEYTFEIENGAEDGTEIKVLVIRV